MSAGLPLHAQLINLFAAILLWTLDASLNISMEPFRAFVGDNLPSEQRATVLSFDSVFGSTGGVVIQPVLGKAADAWGYPVSYALSAAFQALAVT